MKRNSKTIIPYENIDCELVELIKCINKVDGIETKNCCCGHGTNPCRIWFKADSIEDVTHFIYNYLYCNPLWRIVFDLTDNEICDKEWNNPTYLLETTCSDYFYTGVSIDNLKYEMQQKQRELKGENNQKPIERTKYIDGDLLFSKIAGHSDYHGDNILSAISCLQEGKKISTISAIGDNE